jgi:uncharacterized SAM-binding protein YcdF (DUF218 family)
MSKDKRFISITLLTVGALLMLNALTTGIMSSFHIGVVAELFIGAAFALYGCLWRILTPLKWLNVAALILLIALVFSVSFLFIYGHTGDTAYDEDAVIVLGAGLRGEAISNPLERRLIETMRYQARNPNALICVTGGQGKGESITEAEAEARYLIRCGVSSDRIILEDRSISTLENLLFAKLLLDKRFADSYTVVVITNPFHAFRAQLIAKGIGLTVHRVGSSGDGGILAPSAYLRELAAIAAQIIGI